MDMAETNGSIGAVQRINIDDEMKEAYLDYAMSVIVSRALPDARDGLKPVHRRILYAMYDMGLRPDRPYKKSARIVGEVLGKYHPHGDSAVYDSMVRMAQDFSMRYPLVDPQGNFGSVDGDNAAAMRYTEARLTRVAMEMLTDIDRETVDWKENFDGSIEEPEVLPARLPNLLVNGGGGIAVGMATNIPPHNLAEVCDAAAYVIDNWERLDDVTVDDLMGIIRGPDFPTGGLILGTEGVRSAFATGRGRVIMRATSEIEEMAGNRFRIVVSEIPYQVNKSTLIEKIAELVHEGRLSEISDLRDESDRRGMRIAIELKRGTHPGKVRNKLFKYTALQSTFGVNTLALVEGSPRLLPLKAALRAYVDHRREVIARRTEYDLAKARDRAHILEGLLIALDNLDAVIETIRRSPSADEALTRLMARFDLSERQSRAILDMQLRRLAALERQKITDEYAEIQGTIAYLEDLLAHPEKILQLVREDLVEIRERYGDERRTKILPDHDGSLNDEDLIPNIPLFVTLTERGYIKRVPAETYRAQHRGGKGITGMKTRDEDSVMDAFTCMAHDDLLIFTDRGKVYKTRAYELPDASRVAKGVPLINIVQVEGDERATAVRPIRDWESKADYFVLLTENGRVKRVSLDQFRNVRSSGLIAINLDENDRLRWVKMTHGDDDIIVVTARGQSIRFHECDARAMGRAAAGVMAIRLEPHDRVASVDVVEEGADLLVVTANGYGKRTPLDEYARQGRFGKGVRTIARAYEITGPIVDARVVFPGDEITLISADGMVMRTRVDQISQYGRSTRGVRVMDLRSGDRVASLALLDEGTLSHSGPTPAPAEEAILVGENGAATNGQGSGIDPGAGISLPGSNDHDPGADEA